MADVRIILCIIVVVLFWIVFAVLSWSPSCRAVVFCGRGDFKFDALTSHHVAHSTKEWLSPAVFGALRLLIGIFIVVNNAVKGVELELRGSRFIFTFFTNWAFGLLGVYFLVAGLSSIVRGGDEDQPSNFFERLAWVLFEVSFPMAVLIWLMVWFFIFPAEFEMYGWEAASLSFYGLLAHNGNVIFLVLESWLNKMILFRPHMLFAAVFGNAYISYVWAVVWPTQGRWPYFFFELQLFTSIVYIVLLATMCLFFLLVEVCINPCLKRGASVMKVDASETSVAPPAERGAIEMET